MFFSHRNKQRILSWTSHLQECSALVKSLICKHFSPFLKPSSLHWAEHLVCKNVQPWLRVSFASTSQPSLNLVPYTGQNISFARMFSPGWESRLQALLNLLYTLFPTTGGMCGHRESTETWVDLRQATNYFLVLTCLSSNGSLWWCFGSLRISVKLDSVSNKLSKDLGIFFLQCIVVTDSFSEGLGELLMYHTCCSVIETTGAFN